MESKTFYNLDTRGWPMVRVSFRGIPKDDAEFKQFLQKMTGLYDRKSRFSILFDTRNLGLPPNHFREGLIQWVNNNHHNAKQYLERSCVLIEHPVIRLYVSFILSRSNNASPVGTKGTIRDCMHFLKWNEIIAQRSKKK